MTCNLSHSMGPRRPVQYSTVKRVRILCCVRGAKTLQVIFRKRATNSRALLREMSYKDKASYDSTPPCTESSREYDPGTPSHSYVLIHMYGTTHYCVWHNPFMCVTWSIHVCDMTHSYVWHDSFMCVAWLIHTSRHMTHSYITSRDSHFEMSAWTFRNIGTMCSRTEQL